MALAVPLFLVMGLALATLLYLLHPPDRVRDVPASRGEDEAGRAGDQTGPRATLLEHIQSERSKLGPWTRGQVNALIALGVAVVLWVMPGILQMPWFEGNWLGAWMGRHIPESVAGIVAAILLFVLPVDLARGRFTLSWSDAVKIDWGTILLFGGGLALGSLMFKTGVAEAMGQGLTSQLGVHSLWLLTGLSIAMAIVLSEAASNTASANMVIPVVIAIAQAAGVSPLPPALGAALGASFGFMLPVSTPPNAIVYGSGLIPLPRMMRAGILFDITGFFIIWAGLYVLCPLLGFV
jgi:sodium-dependent dicarboxylate transporter 2/3/5